MLHYFQDDLEMIYTNTDKECWSELRDSIIFITGGTGFFGIWLVMSFLHVNRRNKLNSKLILLTRDKIKFLKKHSWLLQFEEVECLEGDIQSFEFIDIPIDYIIHAATEASSKLNIEAPLEMFDTIVHGTKRVLDFAKIKNVKSFLLTSSGAVYGKQPSEIECLDENYLGAPITSDPSSIYGEGKRMSELLCSVYNKHYSIPVKIARCYAFVGPFLPLNSHFAVGNFIRNFINNEDILIEGDGTPFRSYMYVADLMVWLWTVLVKGDNNRPYNIGSDQSVTIAQLAEFISKGKVNVIVKTPISNQPALRYVPSIIRAKTELNLGLYTDLIVGIEKTIQFNRKPLG